MFGWETMPRSSGATFPSRRKYRVTSAGASLGTDDVAVTVSRTVTVFVSPSLPQPARRARTRVRLRAPAKRIPTGIFGVAAKLLFDPEELVVLGGAVGSGGSAGLDLARVRRDRQVGDRRVLGLARPVGDDDGVARRLRERDRLQGLGQRPDLIDLDEDRVRDPRFDPALKAVRARNEQIVADELHLIAEPPRHRLPGSPVVLCGAVLDRHDGIAADQGSPVIRKLLRGQLLALEPVRAVLSVELREGRIERDCNPLAVSGSVGRLEDHVDRLLARAQVRRKAALVAD